MKTPGGVWWGWGAWCGEGMRVGVAGVGPG